MRNQRFIPKKVPAWRSSVWRLFAGFLLSVFAAVAVSAQGQTTNYFYEGFETERSVDDWAPENGVWQIGTPTFGPAANSSGSRVPAGTNCVGTVLGGNYPEDTTSRLIGPEFVVPNADQRPRLRFCHWFRFNAGDSGEVQIRVGGGAWTTIAPAFSSTGGDVWSVALIDLSPYAGETVQLGFLFQSHGVICCNYNDVDAGWYIDEVAVVAGPVVFNTHDGFENGWGEWKADGGTWEIGVPYSGPVQSHAGTNCAGTVLGGDYRERAGSANGVSSRLISPPFVVPAAELHPRLKFWNWFAFNSGDIGQVQVKEGTNDWVTITKVNSAAGGGVWSQNSVNLAAFAGKTVEIAFWFQAAGVNCCGYNEVAAGWYIDDVSVATGAPQFANPTAFENGFGDWSADGATWEIGVPAAGPAFTISGTNCAGTVLQGNYQERAGSANGASSRLISPPFIVPPHSANPRLKYWQWFAFNSGDSGRVQVSDGTDNWVTIAGPSGGAGGGVWSQNVVDLSEFAGKTIQVAFLFEAAGVDCCGYNETAPGWYIDDVSIATGPRYWDNPDSFESGFADWASDGGTWEVGAPGSGPGTARTGAMCAATVLQGNYQERVGNANGASSRMSTPPFVVPPALTNPRFRYWHWFAFNSGDSGRVQIKAGTNDWVTLSAVYTGTGGGVWTQPPAIDLSAYAGQTVQVAFWFQAQGVNCCGYNETSSGWYVDDVRLLHEFTVFIAGSPMVQTQSTACVDLVLGSSTLQPFVNFTIEHRPGFLSNPVLTLQGCWSGSLLPLSGSEWALALTNGCSTGISGVQAIGSLCFDATSENSGFVPLKISGVLGPAAPVQAFGSRAIVLGDEPLLEAWVDGNGKRMATVFGKANATYAVFESSSTTGVPQWSPAWTNQVPAELFIHAPVQGSLSNAPVLFLRAQQQ